MKDYDHKKIEKKWQTFWEKEGMYHAKDFSKKPKYYSLIEFPYPSGDGLHVGHPRPYIGMDVISRKRRLEGFNVLYPIGWDAFGLPTENFAIKTGKDPRIVTKKNSDTFRRQIKSLGISFDWSREINTTDPKYYKWTQWIFLQFLKKGLAYKAKMTINWCPKDKIGLANEEVVGGCCERCGAKVEKREKEQWMLAITKYAERLDKDLDTVDYSPQIKLAQRNWIGKSKGAEIEFKIEGNSNVKVFTTRPDTIFGATYLVLAPEHNLVQGLKPQIKNWSEVENYIKKVKQETDIERTSEDKIKTGVELKGIKAINPATKEEIPVWIADYVLATYGTGAIMAVPAHDERDFEFAKKYNLEIKNVNDGVGIYVFGDTKEQARIIELIDEAYIKKALVGSYSATKFEKHWIHTFVFKNQDFKNEFIELIKRMEFKFTVGPYVRKDSDLKIINSEQFNGLSIEQAKKEIIKFVGGKEKTTFKLRDWLFSRQHYWGEPIPVVHCEKCGIVPLPEKDLPLELPKVKNYQPTDTGESPLASITKWVNTKCPRCKGKARRETDTMPNWAGSSWYYLRYTDPKNAKEFASTKNLKYWTPVDWYNGGNEHTTLHLLYSRFWHKFLYDLKLVPTSEPYKKRTSHGMILGEGGVKMSKSLGNVINPDEMVKIYGTDTLRVYEMFMGPFGQSVAWSTESIIGARRFIEKVWRTGQQFLKQKNYSGLLHPADGIFPVHNSSVSKILHKTIKKVSEDIESMNFNTAISSMMILATEMEKAESVSVEDYKKFLQILSPFAPHVAEELWSMLEKKKSINLSSWPKWDEKLIEDEEINIVVQINGKVRTEIIIKRDENEEGVNKKALDNEIILKYIAGKKVQKTIYVKNRLINIVI